MLGPFILFVSSGNSRVLGVVRVVLSYFSNRKQRKDFDYILCLDVSRWGRFQDIDLSAQYSAECKRQGKQVIYTTIGKPKENDPLYPV
jgi:DNA invertase Pin-like site-specific DNA recombinase